MVEGAAEVVVKGWAEVWLTVAGFLGTVLNPASALLIKFAAFGFAAPGADKDVAEPGTEAGGDTVDSLLPEISGI